MILQLFGILIVNVLVCYGSYLDLPRITFAGQFRADISTVNNYVNNYNTFDDSGMYTFSFNELGTGEISFFGCTITSVTYRNGTISHTDPLVNKLIVTNPQMSPPKLVNFDPEIQNKSIIFGMKFGVSQNNNNDLAFLGDWQPSVIAQNVWTRISCLDEWDLTFSSNTHWFGSKGTSRITNVTWSNTNFSEALNQLRDYYKDTKELSVGQTYFFYTRNYQEYIHTNFTLGYVVGTIGVAEPNESLNFGGERLMSFEDVKQSDIAFPSGLNCRNIDAIRMYKAPFVVNEKEQRLTVDFGNAISMDKFTSFRNLSTLYLGILYTGNSSVCVQIIANISYLEENWLKKTAGVLDVHLDGLNMCLLASAELVVVRSTNKSDLEVCLNSLDMHFVQILLKETAYFVRPLEDYVFHLEYNQSKSVKLKVTHFGRPSNNTTVTLQRANPWAVPEDGINVESMTAVTDSEGVAEFNFTGGFVPYPRNSSASDKLLDIDGQVYRFIYNVTPLVAESCKWGQYNKFINSELAHAHCMEDISIIVWSHLKKKQYTWVEDIEPIFRQYYILYPVMSNILNLSDYCDVVQTHNIELLNYSMRLDINHPSYMPVTRDLSPVKRDMILEWLRGNPPRFSDQNVIPSPKCSETSRKFTWNKKENFYQDNKIPEESVYSFIDKPLFSAKSTVTNDAELTDCECTDTDKVTSVNLPKSCYQDGDICEENITGMEEGGRDCGPCNYYNCIANKQTTPAQWQLDAKFGNCSLHTLRQQLQQAVQLEFYTIPLYLTSLWTIKGGCNQEVHEQIRSVVMQEMLHMVQVANILIAVGGRPIIDSSEWAPKYPAIGLPGKVLPKLDVTLEKASKCHIWRVFMGVEYPHNMSVASNTPVITNSTISQFYNQTLNCMKELVSNNSNIFNGSQLQIEWPWSNTYGTVYKVCNLSTAEWAINEIQEQGEGASPIDPMVNSGGDGGFAHFYKFKEVVCGKQLIKFPNNTYSFSGNDISFNESDVCIWPMRKDPSSRGIDTNTNAHTEARVFHGIYRNLLKKLQNVFDGAPEELKDAVSIMESLQVHGKKLMTIPLNATDPNSPTVGPVWDYEWEEESTSTVDPDSVPDTV